MNTGENENLIHLFHCTKTTECKICFYAGHYFLVQAHKITNLDLVLQLGVTTVNTTCIQVLFTIHIHHTLISYVS